MNKLIFTLVTIILIISVYTSSESECTLKKINEINEDSRRILSSTELSEEDCNPLRTSDDTIYKCTVSNDKTNCIETARFSECISEYNPAYSRRLSNDDLEKEDCEHLKTSNDTAFECIVSQDKKTCIEASKCILKLIPTNSRRLSTELTEEDCSPLPTSDDTKFKCIVSDDGDKCIEASECASKSIGTNSRRLSTELTEEECKNLQTFDDTKFKCTVSDDGEKCIEIIKNYIVGSECVTKYNSPTSRRLSTDLTEDDCNKLRTSDDTRFKCVLNSIENNCEEVTLSNTQRPLSECQSMAASNFLTENW